MSERPKIANAGAPEMPIPVRLSVLQIQVRPEQVWFHCPRCQEPLEGFLSDPRGRRNIVCSDCGEEFDIPASAALIIV